MPNILGRDPKDILIRAQIYVLWQQRKLRDRDQVEWENLAEAEALMEKCLKLVKEKK